MGRARREKVPLHYIKEKRKELFRLYERVVYIAIYVYTHLCYFVSNYALYWSAIYANLILLFKEREREKYLYEDILKRRSKWNSVIVHYIHNIHLKISYRQEFSDFFIRCENFRYIYIYIYIYQKIFALIYSRNARPEHLSYERVSSLNNKAIDLSSKFLAKWHISRERKWKNQNPRRYKVSNRACTPRWIACDYLGTM